ncbi:MAG: hypothetical protein Q9195_002612 [Heterodermia aff. obscurata]
MSYAQSSSNGHLNGSNTRSQIDHYDEDLEDGGPASASRVRRAGGYSGFLNESLPLPLEYESAVPSRHRSPDADWDDYNARENSNRGARSYMASNRSRSQDRVGRGSSNSRAYGSGPGGKQIEGVIQHIEDNWDVLTKDDCVPVHVALQLMDHSSLGRGNDYHDFQSTSQQLQKALKAIVNEHHQGFNSSIGTFHKIQSSIQASQTRVRALRDSVQDAKTSLMIAKPELKGMGTSSQRYGDILHVLGQIEKLQAVPEQLDARISEKHFLIAVDLLQDALRMIRRSDMENVASASSMSALPNTWGRPLYRFLDSLDTSTLIEDDASRNPEVDSFQYINLILESLNRLGHLDSAIDTIAQRLPVELFAIVDKTNQEVDLRHPSYLRNSQSANRRSFDLQKDDKVGQSRVLDDLLSTLYSKFEAIAEGHRAVHDVVVGIAKREGLGTGKHLSGGFKEMWKLYQSERVFKLAGIDKKSVDLATEQEDLDQILKASVPGLVSKSRRRSGVNDSKMNSINGPAAGHKLLIEPSVFNICTLLPPSLGFLQRLKDIVPPDSDIAISTLTSFLDDFLVNVFYPQLDETVTELCSQAFIEMDAFQKDPQWSQKASRPLFKGTSTFFALIQAFCKLLQTIPQDPSFTQLLVSQIAGYHTKCSEWYQGA